MIISLQPIVPSLEKCEGTPFPVFSPHCASVKVVDFQLGMTEKKLCTVEVVMARIVNWHVQNGHVTVKQAD